MCDYISAWCLCWVWCQDNNRFPQDRKFSSFIFNLIEFMKKPTELKTNFVGLVLIIKSISLTNVTFLIFLFDPLSCVWSLILRAYWGLSSDEEFHILKHSLLGSLWSRCLSKCILKLFSYEKTAQPESLLSLRRWDGLSSSPLQKSAVLTSHHWMDIKGPLLLNSTTTVVPITHAVPTSNGNKFGQQADLIQRLYSCWKLPRIM